VHVTTRHAGELTCHPATDIHCVTPYLPYLYYEDNEYMQGWAMDGGWVLIA
jgi:hypothetical protein